MFAELEHGLSGSYPTITKGMGSDCKRHRCYQCGISAPEEGHTCEQKEGLPICDECLEL